MKKFLIPIAGLATGALTAWLLAGCATGTNITAAAQAVIDIQTAQAAVDVADVGYNLLAVAGEVPTNDLPFINASVAAFNTACASTISEINTGGTNYTAWVTNITAMEQSVIAAINASKAKLKK